MRSNQEIVINLVLDWKVILVILVLIGVGMVATSGTPAVIAQGPRNPNDETRALVEPAAAGPGSSGVGAQGPLNPNDDTGTLDDATPAGPGMPAVGDQGSLNPNSDAGTADDAAPAATGRSAMGALAAQGFVTLRSYYLTDAVYNADQALTACAGGYHMASIWELFDTANLAYAYSHPDAHTKDDSGQGPPAYWYGWVRTGWSSSGSDIAGIGNCQAWTSTASGEYGSIARLDQEWTATPTVVAPWDTRTFYCGGVSPVWCVED
jgi:hypothetical protein